MIYAKDNVLSTQERMFWIALFYVFNGRAMRTYNPQTKSADWPDGFIIVTNDELHLFGNMNKKAILTVRNQLKQRGLIDFKAGAGNTGVKPMYKINYLTAGVRGKNALNYSPNYVTNYGPNYSPNYAPNNGPNTFPTSPPQDTININNNIYPSDDEDDVDDPGVDAENARTRTREDEDTERIWQLIRQAVVSAFTSFFGRTATTEEADRITQMTFAGKLPPSMAIRAIEMAAAAGARSPVRYIGTIFQQWHTMDIVTPTELGHYQFLHDCARGKDALGLMTPDEACKEIAKDAEERAEAHAKAKEEYGAYYAIYTEQ
ncbi:MAG: DnaD domain protein [Succinivibrionaceae bacterium]|nr:DnaD domain protein [Succinivibrionaceae bacterium]